MTRTRLPRRIITCAACQRTRPHHARGWCGTCYAWWRDAGQPAEGVPPRRPGGAWTITILDELAVQHAIAGYRIALTPVDRRAAVAQLRARGLIARTIADRLGCATRTVERHLAALKKGR